jgi:hypothetical protein
LLVYLPVNYLTGLKASYFMDYERVVAAFTVRYKSKTVYVQLPHFHKFPAPVFNLEQFQAKVIEKREETVV